MKRWHIAPARGLRGELTLPDDLAIGQVTLLLAALADSPSFVRMRAPRAGHLALAGALRALGVPVAQVEGGFRVAGVGLHGLKSPSGALGAGGSESTLLYVASLLSVQGFGTRVGTDVPLGGVSVRPWVLPLRARGLHVSGTEREDGDLIAPVSVAPLLPGEKPHPVEIQIPRGDVQTKTALLLTGLYADGVTAIEEGVMTADHLERALVSLGLPVQTMGGVTLLDPAEGPLAFTGFDRNIPGDFSLAAVLIAMATAVSGSDLTLRGVGSNRSRTAYFDALRSTGAHVDVLPKGDTEGHEPLADMRVRSASLSSLRVSSELAMRAMEEVPAFVALVPAVRGRVSVRDVGRLRERPGRVLARAVDLLRAFGVDASEFDDGFDAERQGALRGAHVTADMPASLKLASLSLALAADGTSTLDAPEALDALYPELKAALVGLGASITEEDVP
jgi:3-phosphoshikimate 1-carboxyvinyltransferase